MKQIQMSLFLAILMGAGYELMTHLAARVDAALLNGLQRIQLARVIRDFGRAKMFREI
jgi:hypothetical protein